MYKNNQGLWVRWGAFFCLAILFIFASYRCYNTMFPNPESVDKSWLYEEYVSSYTIPLLEISLPPIHPKFIISFSVGLVLVLASAFFCFSRQKTSDFLIDTQSEIAKVSWPTMKEVSGSLIAVIITIVILSLYLFGVDIGLDFVLKRIFY